MTLRTEYLHGLVDVATMHMLPAPCNPQKLEAAIAAFDPHLAAQFAIGLVAIKYNAKPLYTETFEQIQKRNDKTYFALELHDKIERGYRGKRREPHGLPDPA